MSLNSLKYFILSKLIKTVMPDDIISKKLSLADKKLYYERQQFLSYFLQKEIKHEQNIQSKLKNYIKNGDTIFDIGANIGQYSLLFSELVGHEGKVFSFEPDLKSYCFLQFNAKINNCKNINCLNYGVGNTDNYLQYYRDLETGGRRGSFKKGFVENNVTESVQIKSLDTIISEFGHPQFIKIDVEGFEEEIVCKSNLVHDETTFLVEVRNNTRYKIFNFFNSRKFSCLQIDTIKNKKINNIKDLPTTGDLLFIKK